VNRAQIFEFFRRLAEANPAPTTELEYGNVYQLLVAVVLSAQATDAGVNIATRDLFKRIKNPAQMVALGEDSLRNAIKTIGLFNTKAKNVIALSQALIEHHNGEVPRYREQLQALPGVGRKTANVVLNTAFGEETFAVDTHVFRVCNRTGLAPGKTVEQVEAKLEKLVPQPFRRDAHHWLILHGRYTCKARLPECWRCPVIDLCRYKPKTPPPSARSAKTATPASSAVRTAKARTASTRSANRSRSRPTRLP
jgi:endonuclease III